MKNNINDNLDILFPNPVCELNYNKDYELLIAVVLSAQCTDKRVNEVTKILFSKYDLNSLAAEDVKVIQEIIYPVGTHTRKSAYIKTIAERLIKEQNGIVPNNRAYLESLPGVGRKVCNVILSELFQEPAIAVDTHVARVSKRLGIAKDSDDVLTIEKKLMKCIPKDKWSKSHLQLVLFGRYICKSKNPDCGKCPFECQYRHVGK